MPVAGRVLIAGVGNIFFADDAFGVETVRRLTEKQLPQNVDVMDFGIRGYDLAYAIMHDYDAVILIDAIQRGKRPGTISVLDLNGDIETFSRKSSHLETEIVNAHGLDPYQVVQMAKRFGGQMPRVFLVGCEPQTLESDDVFGLSSIVLASIPRAIVAIESLLSHLLTTVNGQSRETYALEN